MFHHTIKVFDYQIALKVNDKNVFQYKFYLHTSATNCENFDNNGITFWWSNK